MENSNSMFGDMFSDMFESYFGSAPNVYEADLDKYWCKHIQNYYTVLNNAKSAGYRVFRNKEGKHKVVKK